MSNGYVSGREVNDIRDDVEDAFPAYSSQAKATIVASLIQMKALMALTAAVQNMPERAAHETVLAMKHMGWDSAGHDIACALENIACALENTAEALRKP